MASFHRIAAESRHATAAAVAAAVLVLGGCGGGSDEADSSGTKPLESSPTGPQVTTAPTAPESTTQAPSPADSKESIATAIEFVLAPGNTARAKRAACGSSVTDRYVETTYGNRNGCVRAQLPGSGADLVEFGRIQFAGAKRAKVFVMPSGGPSSGELITVRLVYQGSVWKVDSLRSNAPVGP